MGRLAMELCGKNAGYQVQPRQATSLDLAEVGAAIEREGGSVLADAGVLLVVRVDIIEVSVYRNGKLLVKTPDKDAAERVATAIYAAIGVPV